MGAGDFATGAGDLNGACFGVPAPAGAGPRPGVGPREPIPGLAGPRELNPGLAGPRELNPGLEGPREANPSPPGPPRPGDLGVGPGDLAGTCLGSAGEATGLGAVIAAATALEPVLLKGLKHLTQNFCVSLAEAPHFVQY